MTLIFERFFSSPKIHRMQLAKRLRHFITRDIFARRDICALATFSHGAAQVFQVLIA